MALEQNVSWSEIESMIKALAKKISNSSRTYSSITTLSRGGLVPSRLLADHLGIKKILVDKKSISSNSLFVDDIFDTGDTFAKILPKVDNPSKLTFVTLFVRREKKYPKQLIYAKKTASKQGYVVFPWDRFEFQRSKK
ncbi:hypothetical protein BD31_I0148 [Candidatus Nitrosopumilus salaria BD31]|uniref:Phosphoribosyl transferase domain protein n=1 Tax=Candidatus Nitrosopumilus salarius BD31 TaxID=859350 RepID=I3D2A2_9ARCH|nr:hypothetical protein BD31_I0148 [Candidatus Nitrosopumilus salaria BD31]